jgi:hypothetical protein
MDDRVVNDDLYLSRHGLLDRIFDMQIVYREAWEVMSIYAQENFKARYNAIAREYNKRRGQQIIRPILGSLEPRKRK